MKRSSWVILCVCAALAVSLVAIYRISQSGGGPLTGVQARAMVQNMQDAVEHKNVNTIMDHITTEPDAKLVNLKRDQLRLLLARAFRNSQDLRAEVKNFTFTGGTGSDATAEFDLALTHDEAGLHADVYSGRITLQLHRMEVPRMFGLYTTHDWRIIGAQTTGVDPSGFGEF